MNTRIFRGNSTDSSTSPSVKPSLPKFKNAWRKMNWFRSWEMSYLDPLWRYGSKGPVIELARWLERTIPWDPLPGEGEGASSTTDEGLVDVGLVQQEQVSRVPWYSWLWKQPLFTNFLSLPFAGALYTHKFTHNWVELLCMISHFRFQWLLSFVFWALVLGPFPCSLWPYYFRPPFLFYYCFIIFGFFRRFYRRRYVFYVSL